MKERRGGSLSRGYATPTLLGAAVAFLGCAFLVSWYVQTLRTFTPEKGVVSMQYNTAVGFVITGLSVVAHCIGRRRLAFLGGALAAGLGSMALAEQVTGRSLGLLGQTFGAGSGVRSISLDMSPNTALAFALTGCLLLAQRAPRTRRRWRVMLAGIIAAGIAASGFAGLLNYVLGDPASHGWARFTQMQAHTAVGFLGLGTAFFVMLFRIRGEPQVCSLPNWASWTVGLGVAALSVALWSSLTASDARLNSIAGTRSHEAALAHANQVLQSHLRDLKRLAGLAAEPGAARSEYLRREVRACLGDMPGMSAVAWLDEEGRPGWIEGDLGIAGLQQALERRPELRSARDLARVELAPTVSDPATIIGSNEDVYVFVPALDDGRLRGLLAFRHELRPFFDWVFGDGVGRAFDVRLLTGDQRTFYASDAIGKARMRPLDNRGFGVNSARIAFADKVWLLQGEADPTWMASAKNAATTLILWFGLFLAAALVAVIRNSEILRQRATSLEEAKHAIEDGAASLREANDSLAAQAVELRQVHDELTAAAREKRHVLDSLSAFLIGVDARGRVTEWNSVAGEEFGIPDASALGRPFDELEIPWDRALVRAAIDEALAGAERVRREGVTVRGGGDNGRVVALTVCRMSAGGGRGFAIIGADVTELQMLELQLQHAQKLESVGTLAAGIAHEINTPMQFVSDNLRFVSQSVQPLLGVLEVLPKVVEAAKEGRAPDAETAARLAEANAELDVDFLAGELPAALGEMQEGVTRVTTIVRAMKDFSHPGNQGRQSADVNKAIATTLAVARNEYKYVADVETDFGDIPPVDCYIADLNQVFLNLLVNGAHAIKDVVGEGASQRGTIRVSTRLDGDFIEIRFSDSGGGIPERVRAKIFDQFFTTKPVGKGTGLGLAIARSVVVEKHGGTIHFETELGKGTTFIVRIPSAGAPLLPDGPPDGAEGADGEGLRGTAALAPEPPGGAEPEPSPQPQAPHRETPHREVAS